MQSYKSFILKRAFNEYDVSLTSLRISQVYTLLNGHLCLYSIFVIIILQTKSFTDERCAYRIFLYLCFFESSVLTNG